MIDSVSKKQYQREWSLKNKDKRKKYNSEWRKKNREHLNAYYKNYLNNNPDKKNKYQQRTAILRKKVIEHYGARCVCCNETHYEFLSVDHVNNDGYIDRKNKLIGSKLFKWIINNNYPSKFQVLCFNCNLSKGFWGYCTHSNKTVL